MPPKISVWDTGLRNSNKNAYIPYTGVPLQSKQRYDVLLTVTDNHGESDSIKASFETGLLHTDDWSASWIAAPKGKKHKPGFGNQQSSVYMREHFPITAKIKTARIYATAHGVYELFVNNVRPDDRYFAPEHTTYGKYLCYQTYDVTDLLKQGDNIIGLHLGNGWYYSFGAKPNTKTDGCLAALFQLEITYTDGTTETLGSSDRAEWTLGPAIADLWAGEKYDASIELKDWTSSDPSRKWAPVKVMKYGYDNLVPQNQDRVRAIAQLPVKQILQSPKGECILDFGQNMAGIVQMRTSLKAGQTIRLEHCEVLDKDGNYFNNILNTTGVSQGIDQTDEYISSGQPSVYSPHFTYHGFRYAKVTIDGSAPASLDPADFTALLLSTEKENTGTFSSSDEKLNQLYHNIRWSQYSNMLSIPTDCPQREKAGWTGDMLVYSKTALLNEDCTLLFSRWLENMYQEQDSYGIIPMVVPEDGNYPSTGKIINLTSGMKGKATSSGWGDAAVFVPLSMYEITGNTEVLKKQYFCMRRWCDYIISRAKNNKPKNCTRPDEIEKYLWDTGYHYGEWLIPSQSKNGMDMKHLGEIMAASSCYTAPIFGWLSVKYFADIITILAKEEPANALYATDAPKYRAVAAHMKDAIQKGVIGKDGNMPSDLCGAYVLPIYFDLVPEEYKETFAQNLVQSIEKNDMCMDTGFLATPYLLDALCLIGRRRPCLHPSLQGKGSFLDV